MKKYESGRSMVEMLGVLAIIGVLSVGGIAGYTMAMKKYKVNEIVAYASQCAVLAQAQLASTGSISNDDCKTLVGTTKLPTDATAMKVAKDGDAGKVKITLTSTLAGDVATAVGTDNQSYSVVAGP